MPCVATSVFASLTGRNGHYDAGKGRKGKDCCGGLHVYLMELEYVGEGCRSVSGEKKDQDELDEYLEQILGCLPFILDEGVPEGH